jgi:hypothetical protein
MPTLCLDRRCQIIEDHPHEDAHAIVEMFEEGPEAWVVRMVPNPGGPRELWHRQDLEGRRQDLDGRRLIVYSGLYGGYYEAHSALTSDTTHTVYFHVTDDGSILVLGGEGDEEYIIACHYGMDPRALVETRAGSATPEPAPPLLGTPRQVAWAARSREIMRRRLARDPEAIALLETITDASWFLTNRERPVEELRNRLAFEGLRRRLLSAIEPVLDSLSSLVPPAAVCNPRPPRRG